MTDLEPYTGVANLPVLDDGGTALITRTVQQMQGAHQIATALANTTFVPYQWRGKPDDVAAAILYGAAIGLDPMSALRGLYVVNGNPGMYARQMAALVMSKGHTVRTVEVSDTVATVSGQRRGSDFVETVTWTIERAKTAGYVPTIDPKTGKYRTNDKGKLIGNEKYLTDPQSMLYARALGDVCRRIAPDALAGLDYTVEELQVIKVESEIVRDERPKRESAATLLGTGGIGDTAASAPAEPVNPASVADPAKCDGNHASPRCDDPYCWQGEPPDGITQPQLRKMGALMHERGLNERAKALAFVAKVIGRDVSSRNELTTDEARKVIDALEAMPVPAAEANNSKSSPSSSNSGSNDAAPAWEPIATGQVRALGAQMRRAGISDDDAAKARLLSHAAGRPVATARDFDADEANRVIDQLQALNQDELDALVDDLKQQADEQAQLAEAEAELAARDAGGGA